MKAASASEFTRRWIPTPEGTISVLDFGDPARPVDVVFSNGNGFNAMCHRQALQPLGERMRILAMDQRGCGFTRLPVRPEGRQDWWDLGQDLVDLIAALDQDRPVVLAGHSMGGVISLMAATRAPAKVNRLILFDPVISGLTWSPETMPERLAGLITATRRRRSRFADKAEAIATLTGRGVFATWPAEVLADYVEGGFLSDADGGVRLACSPEWEVSNYAAQSADAKGLLAATARPATVYRAGVGTTCRVEPDDPAVLANRLIRIETVAGATHCLPMERPDVVRQALVDAVAS